MCIVTAVWSKMLGLYFAYLSFISQCLCSNPYTFEVKNVNLTIQLLKRLNYKSITEDLKEDIHSKLASWEETFAKDPLLFEHPIRSFLLMKMLRVDIQYEMIPKHLKFQFRKNVKVPTKQELGKSVIVINDMMKMYKISIHEVIVIICISIYLIWSSVSTLVRVNCMRCHGTKCPLLTVFFLFLLSSFSLLLGLLFSQKGIF